MKGIKKDSRKNNWEYDRTIKEYKFWMGFQMIFLIVTVLLALYCLVGVR